MIITKQVEIKITASNYRHYQNLGYRCDLGDVINVDVNDLTPRSTAEIEVQCDCCRKQKKMKHNYYRERIEEHGNYYCKDCWHIRMTESIRQKYGVDDIMQLEDVRKKLSITKRNQSRQIKDEITRKKIETSRAHYGTDFPVQSKEVQEKIKQTNLERYGVDVCMKNPNIQRKATATMMEKYGAPYSSQVPEIRKKIAETFYNNQTVRTSAQQKYLAELYEGQLNAVVGYYNVDILLEEDKIACEYDGKGHDLRVTLHYCTREEFDGHEIVRDKHIKSHGYKIIKIISSTDRLPSPTILLDMLESAKQYFAEYPNHSWREYDIESGVFRDAEHMDGHPYDYGQLHVV